MKDPIAVSKRHRVVWPSLGWVFGRAHRALAFGFGSGLLRPGSGTWGSLLALVLWWPMAELLPWVWLGVLLALAAISGVWICHRATDELGVQDHVGVVWDEMVAVWIVLWALPDVLWVSLFGFVLFRLFDIAKPWPICKLDAAMRGGLGVMVDDWVAALYAVALAWTAWWLAIKLGFQGVT